MVSLLEKSESEISDEGTAVIPIPSRYLSGTTCHNHVVLYYNSFSRPSLHAWRLLESSRLDRTSVGREFRT